VCTDGEGTERYSYSGCVYGEIDIDGITFQYLRMLKEREWERERKESNQKK
jgi:hypothetical protein